MSGLHEFGILFVASLVGAAAVIPYSLRMAAGKTLNISKPVLYTLALAQNAVLFGIAIWLGLLAAHAIGLGAPYIEAMLDRASLPSSAGLIAGVISGTLAGVVLLVADLFFLSNWPQALRDMALKTTTLENILASLYGGINEELLMRLFGLSALAWLLQFAWHSVTGVLWMANVLTTFLFGLGHLPALKAMLGTISRLMLVRSLLLNAPIGLLCGWLFWTYGIESAILAHFSADIVYHVFGTVFLKKRLTLSTSSTLSSI